MYDLLLFDLDGTLSDPLEGSVNCTNYALSTNGFAEIGPDEVAALIGPPLNEAFEAIVGSDSAELIDALVASYRERQGSIGWTECCLYPGVVDALNSLAEEGNRLAVCTSKPTTFAIRILERFKLVGLFEFIDGGDVRFPKWRQIQRLREEGRVPAKSIMIGDRAVDLAAAHRNGIEAAAVLWGYGSRIELEREAPKHLFQSPAEWLTLSRSKSIPTGA
jgi:phosphoglycolate phosphatase